MKSNFSLVLMLLSGMWVGAATAQERKAEDNRFTVAQLPNEAETTGVEVTAEDSEKQVAVEAKRAAKAEAARLKAEQKAKAQAEKQAAKAEAERLKAEQEARVPGEPAQAVVTAESKQAAEAARLRAEQKARMSGESAQAAAVTAESKQEAEAARLRAEQKARMTGEPAQAAVTAESKQASEAARLRAEQKARMAGEPAQAAAVTAESKQEAEAARLRAEQKARMSGEPVQASVAESTEDWAKAELVRLKAKLQARIPSGTTQATGAKATAKDLAKAEAERLKAEQIARLSGELAQEAAGHKVQLSLKTLGIRQSLRISGADSQSNVDFSFHTVDIVERLRLRMHYKYSPALNPEASFLKILLNGQEVGVLELPKETAMGTYTVLEIDPLLLQEWNRLTFQFVSHMEKPLCDDPRSQLLWIDLFPKDTIIEADTNTLPVADDLALFPVPFFDKHDVRDLTLPFVFSERPSWVTLKSAGILASWFGKQADWRKVHFPSHLNAIPEQNAIVLATSQDHIDGIDLPVVTDGVATITMIRNPRNPNASLLLVVGNDENGLVQAAQAITLGQVQFAGAQQSVQTVQVPKRVPFDSSSWLPLDKKISLGEIVPPGQLVSNGVFVSPHEMILRIPPNLHRAEAAFIPLDFAFESSNNSRYLVRVDALFNGAEFQHEEFGKPPENAPPMLKHRVLFNIPTKNLTGKDTIAVKYTFADKKHETCNTAIVKDEIRVDPNSTIDLTDPLRYVQLPDLSYVAYTGYPFSKLADLSETVVLMPETPDRYEIESMLTMLGHIGNKTGFPATSVSVSSIRDVKKFADKDILVVGATGRMSTLLESWKSRIQVNLLSDSQPFPYFGSRYMQRWLGWFEASAKFIHAKGKDGMVMVGFESPLQSNRSVVMLAANDSSRLPEEASLLNTFRLAKNFVGDVAVIPGSSTIDNVVAFELGRKYSIGWLSLREYARNFVQHNPWSGAFLAFLVSLLFASMTYRKLKRKSEDKLSQGE